MSDKLSSDTNNKNIADLLKDAQRMPYPELRKRYKSFCERTIRKLLIENGLLDAKKNMIYHRKKKINEV